MSKHPIKRTIQAVLGLAFTAGVLAAATGCDETDMQLLSALGNTLAQGASQQQPSTAQQNPNSSVSDPMASVPCDCGNSGNWSGSYAYAYATTKP